MSGYKVLATRKRHTAGCTLKHSGRAGQLSTVRGGNTNQCAHTCCVMSNIACILSSHHRTCKCNNLRYVAVHKQKALVREIRHNMCTSRCYYTQQLLPAYQGRVCVYSLVRRHVLTEGCVDTNLLEVRVNKTLYLTHCGRVTKICVFTLQLCRTGDADLRFYVTTVQDR